MNAVNAGVLAAGSGASGWLERLRLGFFRSFFQLLLASVALAEWGVAAWVAGQFGARLPSVLHLVGPLVIFVCNRALLTRRRARGLGSGPWVRGVGLHERVRRRLPRGG